MANKRIQSLSYVLLEEKQMLGNCMLYLNFDHLKKAHDILKYFIRKYIYLTRRRTKLYATREKGRNEKKRKTLC